MKYLSNLLKYATCLILSLCFLLMGTCNIYASLNYLTLNNDNCYLISLNNGGYYMKLIVDRPVRAVTFSYNNNDLRTYLVSTSYFYYQSNGSQNNDTCNLSGYPNGANYNTTINGITYYLRYINSSGTMLLNIPVVNDTPDYDKAIYYTYGDGQGEDDPVINWGTLKDIGFSTSLATNGTVNVGLNRDKIYWNGLSDTLDNELTENQKVEIHAQGIYYTQVQAGVISLTEWLSSITFDDIQLSGTSDVLLGTFNANKGYAEFSWNAVANALNIPIQNTSAYKDNDIWYQDGWIYKVRLTDPTTGYIGNWQTLYTITAMPPEQTQNVYNTSFLNENIINVVNEVNNINNETNENNYVTENYEINNTVINYPENPDGNKIIDDSIVQEDEYISQLDTQLTDIDTSPLDLLGIQGIQNAFEWIRAVHLRTVEQTTLGTVTGIIMLIGLAVYLIGRRRG